MNQIESVKETENWKTKTLAIGAVLGALLGLLTAYLLARTAEEANPGNPPKVSTGDALRIGLGLIGVIRGIAALGDK